MPTRAAHAASFCGSAITVGVTAPNMHQTKYQVDMNLNSYVGQLRQQVASKPAFSLPPARLRMFLGGIHKHLVLGFVVSELRVCSSPNGTTSKSLSACWSMCSFIYCFMSC